MVGGKHGVGWDRIKNTLARRGTAAEQPPCPGGVGSALRVPVQRRSRSTSAAIGHQHLWLHLWHQVTQDLLTQVYCRTRIVAGMPLVVGHAVVYIRRHLLGDAAPLQTMLDSPGVRT